MSNKVLQLDNILEPDRLAVAITDKWITWDSMRELKKRDWEEIRRYVYATDTTQTTNAQLPWKNKTTIPKLCQIRDNLFANYTTVLFPQRKWLIWEANEKDSNSVAKRDSIVNYMSWAISQPSFKNEFYKIILDYIDFGNCFGTIEWIDQRVTLDNRAQAGYVGPGLRRINPLDIVMDPTADNFENTPKIVKSLMSMGEVKDYLEKMSTDENRVEYEELYKYLKDIRATVTSFDGDISSNDHLYQMDGFTSYRDYLVSGNVEILTFYGDIYDPDNDLFYKNHVITVVDRHKLINKKPNPSYFGYPPIFHCAWRRKQDNLWGMGPLDNLVGMQYRMDHVENMKADIFDLVTYPVQKIKGFVEDYDWRPGEKIFMGEEGDVELVVPDVNALQANFELQNLERLMEEMAGSPREAMGFRTPGEKTKYEIQRIENAGARLYQSKIRQFEESFVEPSMNGMLEQSRRNMTGAMAIRVFDDELKVASFQSLTPEDITGIGRIKPIGARHHAEQADMIQNLTQISTSPIWQSIAPHVSSVRLSQIIEDSFNLKDYGLFMPFVALSEQADAQKQMQVLEEQAMMEQQTATGMGEDFDLDTLPSPEQEQPQ